MMKPCHACMGVMVYEFIDEAYSIGETVETGATNNPYFDYEVVRCITDSNKCYYMLLIDGDEECFTTSIKDARKYAKHLF